MTRIHALMIPVLAVAIAAMSACASDDFGTNDGAPYSEEIDASGRKNGPLAGTSLYLEPESHAAHQADAWRQSDPPGAALMDWMAEGPIAVWVGDWDANVTDRVDDVITAGGSELRTIVVYNIPHRDCSAWSAGGASNAAAYREFIDDVAEGIDGRKVLVILEPDALGLFDCLSAAQIVERKQLMSEAVDALSGEGARVYIDAGDSAWIPASTMASRLAAAGVHNAAGFALNVSHTETTEDSAAYAVALRQILGPDAHYVVDTSRNGLGPTSDHEWCNPLHRAVGSFPITNPPRIGLDAKLWIKPPGESDGECNGGPSAGAWWPTYAKELADLAT